jgi:hypothetical protein
MLVMIALSVSVLADGGRSVQLFTPVHVASRLTLIPIVLMTPSLSYVQLEGLLEIHALPYLIL